MLKREILYAVAAATLLTVGTANALEGEAVECMKTCTEQVGSVIVVTSSSGAVFKSLSGCSATKSGGTTTTTCVYSAY